MIDNLTIQRVKDAANIVDVVSDFIELRKKGVGYEALCPFHKDRHYGNFFVSEQKNVCKCFACDCNGNGALGPVDFLMQHENLSFVDAIRWLGRKYGIEVEGSEQLQVKARPCPPRTPRKQLPTLSIDYKYIRAKGCTNNALCRWIKELPWSDEQQERIDKIFKNYFVGTSKYGHTIFWQVDEEGVVRTAKLMLYKDDGHRDKERPGNYNWIHTIMSRHKLVDLDKYEMRQTLFGMHLTALAPGATINLVESEKTAIICAIAYGNMKEQLWLATGGKHNLKADMLYPLIQQGRHIVLYPDVDSIDDWRERMEFIGYDKMTIATDFINRNWKPELDGEKADIADILVRIMKQNQTTIAEVLDIMPEIKALHDKFDLEYVKKN